MTDSPTKVLVVDDREANIVALQGLLRRPDAEILVARSGQDALEILLVHEVAVAIVDVQMPGMDGFELAELMRGVDRTRHVPIIFLTAGAQDNERRFRGYDAGAVDYLYKPVEPGILRRKVDVFIELSRQREDLAHQRDHLCAIAEDRSRLVQELKQSEERLRTFASQLEQLVAERTQELVHSQEQLRAMANELSMAEQRERKRMATELHDHLQQMLVLAKLKLGQGKRAAEGLPACADVMGQVDDILLDALTYTRTLVAELSPPVLREFGLPAALKWLGEWMHRHELSVTVEVDVDDPSRLPLPEEQAVLLFQSVRELLINAAKHAKTGRAKVRLARNGDRLIIEVQDEGAGFVLDGAAVPSNASKFGLFSIRERMRALGGWFDMTSSPGQGTTARLTLPLGRAGKNGAGAESPDGAAPLALDGGRTGHAGLGNDDGRAALSNTKRKIRVLLVDDHAMMRQGLRSVLESYADVEVVGEAVNGEEAVTAADDHQPSIVVMDINMPKMNGVEATARIKARHAHIVVIGLSVQADSEAQEAMTKAGAAVLLTKEAAADELYRAMQALLRSGETVSTVTFTP